MTVLNYAGGFYQDGETHPTKQKMDDFMHEKVDYFKGEMPDGAMGWSDSYRISYEGDLCHKDITRTVNCGGGRKTTLKKRVTRDFGEKGEPPKVEVIVPTSDGPAPEKQPDSF